METVARPLAFVLGIVLVLVTVWSVFTALVVPRVTSSRVQRGVARILGGSVKKISPRLPSYEVRDRAMSFVGPAAMVSLFVLWLGLLLLGFALIIWWDAGDDFASALGVAGSSVFTLGIATARDSGPMTLEILAAGLGLLVIALEIAYLPALYNAFATRETEVTLLATRAGTPAWGPEILARHYLLDTMDELPPLYADWERWAATVSESHANYPALMWFRSPVSTRSWLLGLVAMMDSAALYHSVSPTADAARGPAVPVHGNQLPALHGARAAHPLRLRPAAHDRHPPHPRRVRRGLRAAGGGGVPARTRPRGFVAPLPGVAGQLRADRRRPDQR